MADGDDTNNTRPGKGNNSDKKLKGEKMMCILKIINETVHKKYIFV